MEKSKFHDVLVRYATALESIESDITEQKIMEMLITRDTLQASLANTEEGHNREELLNETIVLDNKLREQAALLATKIDLPALRAARKPEEEAWWWQLDTSVKNESHHWTSRLDWIFGGMLAGALAMTASLMMQIFEALSVGGMSWEENFATIAQGGGLALVSGGALTDKGRHKVENVMSNLGIPKRYITEVLGAVSIVMLSAVYTIHSLLPGHFYAQGEFFYKHSDLINAQFKYQQGLTLAPDNVKFNLGLGKVYESMGDLKNALEQYHVVAETGDPWGLNNLGRVLLFDGQFRMAEAYLNMALQRAKCIKCSLQTEQDKYSSGDLIYQIHRNIGWLLLQEQKHEESIPYLTKAIKLDQTIPGNQIGGGMAYCLLSYAEQQINQKDKATADWNLCLERSRPETILEYKWFTDIGRRQDAEKIYTTSIVTGLTEEQFKKMLTQETLQAKRETASLYQPVLSSWKNAN